MRIGTDSVEFAADAKIWKSPAHVPDPLLGWSSNRNHPSITSDGRRQSPSLPATTRISAYGDSFVFGEDVEDHETFPHQLSLMVGGAVGNYGVSGYGPDQAILRLERHLESGKRPEVVILGMPSENIARVVNVIRRLYIPLEGVHFSKPIFVRMGEQWQLLNSVPRWPPTKEALQKTIETSKKYDLWYKQNETRPKAEFPFTLTTFQAIKFFGFDVLRWQNLYANDLAVSTLSYVIRRYVGLSKHYEFTPVFVIIPMPEDLHNIQSNDKTFYSEFLEVTKREFKGDLFVVDVLGQNFDMERFNLRPFSGHASAYGNWVIASAIYENIRPVLDK